MYEDTVPMFRKILWYALWFVVALAVIWLIIWFVFIRKTDNKTASPAKPKANQSQSTPQTSSQNNTSSSSTNATPQSQPNTASGSSASGASGSTTAGSATELANTGPGDLILPVGVATVVGGSLYYIRARRRLV